MVEQASAVGVFRTLLILIGVFFLLRIIGRMMIAKRNFEEGQRLNDLDRQKEKAKRDHMKNEGRVRISKKTNQSKDDEYADFEIIDE